MTPTPGAVASGHLTTRSKVAVVVPVVVIIRQEVVAGAPVGRIVAVSSSDPICRKISLAVISIAGIEGVGAVQTIDFVIAPQGVYHLGVVGAIVLNSSSMVRLIDASSVREHGARLPRLELINAPTLASGYEFAINSWPTSENTYLLRASAHSDRSCG